MFVLLLCIVRFWFRDRYPAISAKPSRYRPCPAGFREKIFERDFS